jgi:hypothetical protein
VLYHVSEDPDIDRFAPRPAPDPSSGQTGLMVWAIDDAHLHNYLLPRNCPRVTFYARPDSNPNDVARFIGPTTAKAIVAIEVDWFAQVLQQTLYVYEFADDFFTIIDKGAGYHIARQTIIPESVRQITDLPAELFARNVELRIMPSLWPLRDAVGESSLQFSMIRMRNAGPRPMPLLFL